MWFGPSFLQRYICGYHGICMADLKFCVAQSDALNLSVIFDHQ